MEERFLAYKVCVTKATINMKEMLLGMFVDFAQCEFIFVSHELQVIEGGGINVKRNHPAELLRHQPRHVSATRTIAAHNDALDTRQQSINILHAVIGERHSPCGTN